VHALSEACTALNGLQDLELSNHERYDVPVTMIVQALPDAVPLTRLHLNVVGSNAIADIEAEASIWSGLQRFTGLQCLEVSFRSRPGAEPDWLWPELPLQALSQLNRLSIEGGRAGEAGVAAIALALSRLTALMCLQLQGTCATSVGVGAGHEAADGDEGDEFFRDDDGHGSNDDDDDDDDENALPVGCKCELLAQTLQALPALADLDLSDNALGSAGFAVIAPSLEQLRGLTALSLAGNELGNAIAPLVADTATTLKGLEHLQVSGNGFSKKVALLLPERVLCSSSV
jgi:hypothetical protein